jgi:carbohydrate kinase (thermoresistant glucokinase family)
MGVAGSGKSTVGRRVAERLERAFLDADDLHSDADRDAMAAGRPLSHRQRDAWMKRVCDAMQQHVDVVVACSALRRRHRRQLHDAGAVLMFFLDVPTDELVRRLRARRAHFFPPSLLESQLETLEPVRSDEPVLIVDADRPIGVIAAEIVDAVSQRGA